MATAENRTYATGRRKCAASRVWIKPGTGKMLINKKEADVYFKRATSVMVAKQSLAAINALDKFDIVATVKGSGLNSQAGAVRHGIARALQKYEPNYRPTLKKAGLLTRDAREKERKKPGQPGARKKFQFSKR